jgi:general secretion pathway protein J
MNSRASQRGYTLVEALIAVAILAAIAGVLAPVTHSAIRAAGRINTNAKLAESSRVGESALAEIFATMVTPGKKLGEPAFVGTRNTINLFVLIDQQMGPQRVSLRIANGDLVLTPPVSDNALGGAAKKANTVALVDHVRSFRYLAPAQNGDPPRWRSAWSESQPPRLVEIVYDDSDGSRRTPRSFAIDNRAALHCAFDQVSRTCRS